MLLCSAVTRPLTLRERERERERGPGAGRLREGKKRRRGVSLSPGMQLGLRRLIIGHKIQPLFLY